MRKTLLFILGVTIMACTIFSPKPAYAVVYDQFGSVATRQWDGLFQLSSDLLLDYTILKDGRTPTYGNDFFINWPNGGTQNDTRLDDGYAKVNLADKLGNSWSYRYNGNDYTSVYVSINGFITFDVPPYNEEVSRDTNGLFSIDLFSMPNNVVAPYWGDHKYWLPSAASAGYTPSEIGYVPYKYEVYDPVGDTVAIRNCILIQWKNLNINYERRVFNAVDNKWDTTRYPGNVASFQVIIYEGPDKLTAQQGEIEFRYGSNLTTERNPDSKGAVGYKGNTSINGHADFVNALYNGDGYNNINFPADQFYQRNYTTLARDWPPSGDPKLAIALVSNYSVNGDRNWGDGDADMSKAEGGRHQSQSDQQNKFVTINDVREIMRSVATDVPLDSVYRQAAFHADVHHDGRYYYLTNRNSGIFRMLMGTNDIVMNASDPDFLINYEELDDIEEVLSQDTFYLRKVGLLEGNFGFKPHYGQNPNYVYIDFRDMPGSGTTIDNCIRKFRIADPGNNYSDDEADYMLMIYLVDNDVATRDFERNLLKAASEENVHTRINMLTINMKKNIIWRDEFMSQNISNLPGLHSPETQLFWEANELDASFILSYLGGKIPYLPWIYENIEHDGKGKVSPYRIADNISFYNAVIENDALKVPVYFNGVSNAQNSAAFKLNTNILNFEAANANVMVEFSNDTKTCVLATDAEYNPSTPIAYLTINTDVTSLKATDVRFRGENVKDVLYKLNTVASLNDNMLAQNSPNPMTTSTSFEVSVAEAGNYKLAIYDMNGNIVKVIADGEFVATTSFFNWDSKNLNGELVPAGTYVYRLESATTSIAKKLVVVR